MPPARRHPSEALSDDLAALYRDGVAQLRTTVELGLRRGLNPERANTEAARVGDSTLAYRAQSLRQAESIIAGLRAQTRRLAPQIVVRSYRAGALAVDRVGLAPRAALEGRFAATVNTRAVETFAANMQRSLLAACDTAHDNVGMVFERADRLEAGLPIDGVGPGNRTFIGRRVDDPYRQAALRSLGQSQVAGDTRRQASAALERRLIGEGTTDAATGFVDRAGKRWALDTYTEMVARTTTREVTSNGTVDRLLEGENYLIEIPAHAGAAAVCIPYEGKVWALEEGHGHEVIDQLPPFHVNCIHVVSPASVSLDDHLAALRAALA